MNKHFIFLSILLVVFSASAAKKTASTPNAVKTLMTNIEALESLPDSEKEKASRIRMENQKLFDGLPSGLNMGLTSTQITELTFVGLPSVSTSNAYCRCLNEYIYERRILKQSNKIIGTEIHTMPGANGKDKPWTYETSVHKTCTCNDNTIELMQIISVDYDSNLISEFKTIPYNKENTKQDYNQTTSPPVPAHEKLTEQQYLNLVSRYYSAKEYNKAFETLQKLVAEYDNSAQGWYRMGLMVFYGQKGCKKKFRNTHKTAVDFLEKAADRASGKLKKEINTELYYMRMPGGNYM